MPAAGEVSPLPRSLVLTPEDRSIVISRLARACLHFQDTFLSRKGSPAGLLCQVWLPEVVEENQIVLKTKGLPFCVAGLGDMLALFRCISCRFAFGTNVQRPNTLGAPGRVFTSSEPEMCCNVQQYSKSAYLRKAEAEQCQVQSTLLLPLFISPRRSGCVGVLEVVQTSEDMAFADVAMLLAAALEKCELYTCDMEAVHRHAPSAARTATFMLPPQMGVLAPPPPGNTSEDDSANGRASDAAAAADCGALGGMAAAQGGGGSAGAADSGDGSADEDDDDDAMSEDEGGGGGRHKTGSGGSKGGGKPRRKGIGNPGKPGVRLTLEDLQSQFGVGLKEAANRLGICPTTLKRACRRHGIQRWPRRQLVKVNKALDELEARQMLQPQQHLAAAPHGGYDMALGTLPAADTRWTTLAHFAPAYPGAGPPGYGGQQLHFATQQGLLPWATMPDPAATAAMQQQALLAPQQLPATTAAQPWVPAAGGGAGSGSQTPAGSRMSLPEGALAMGGGGMGGHAANAAPEASALSGVSTLGQPPPAAQHPAAAGQQQQQQQRATPPLQGQQAQQRRSLDSVAQPPAGLAGFRAADAPLAHPQYGASHNPHGGPGPGGRFLHHGGAAAPYTSPFGPNSGAPVVQLPNGGNVGGAAGMAAGPSISTLSVPSVNVDIMPPLGGGGGTSGTSGGGGGLDDDQVGFLDSSVLELLLTEERRDSLAHSLRGGGAALANGGSHPSASAAGEGAPSAGELLPVVPGVSTAMPGMSAGLSGLSFML